MRKIVVFLFLLTLIISCKKQENKKISETAVSENATPIQKLISGNKRFLEEKTIHPHQDKKTVLKNQNKQHPFAVILSCSDSRVSPEIIFDQGIGDLFVVRNAGNLISNIDMGSIEYAVEHLKAKLVVVVGHTECGAIKAYVADTNKTYKKHLSHIDDIVETIANEKEEQQISKQDNLNRCVIANIKHAVKIIKENAIIKKNNVIVVPMQYDIHTGKTVELID